MKIISLFKKSLSIFRHNFRACLVYEIIYRGLVALVVFLVTTLVIFILEQTTGQAFLNDQAILSFVLSIPGIILIIAIFYIVVIMLAIEKVGLIGIMAAAQSGKKVSVLSGYRLMGRFFGSAVQLGVKKFQHYILWALPFVGVFIILLFWQTNFSFSLASITSALSALWLPMVLLAAGYAIAFLYLWLKWTFAGYALVFEGLSAKQALRRSADIVRGQFWQIAKARLLWLLLIALGVIITTLLLSLLNATGIYGAGENAVFIGSVLFLINIVVLVVLGLIIEPLQISLVTKLYFQESRAAGKKFSAWLDISHCSQKLSRLKIGLVAIVLIAATIITLFFSINYGTDLLAEDNDVDVTAHRGYSAKAPENTISAINAAIDIKADYAEIDVQETADGQVVVFHDDDLKRITGVEKTIGDLTLAELKQLDAGEWFSPEFKGEKIPTLEEAIKAAQGKIKLNIEIKNSSQVDSLSQKVADLITSNNFTADCVVTSFSTPALHQVERSNPNIITGQIAMVVIGDMLSLKNIEVISSNQLNLNYNYTLDARQNHKQIFAWTVNDSDAMTRMIDYGVDNIITDNPELFQQTQADWQKKQTPAKKVFRFLNQLLLNF
ncbi:glycerophosphodiester phosphodiesterase family protein [Patescibacteria group bacterium]